MVAELIPLDRPRENYLSYFGPLSLLLLLTAWVTGLVAGFAMMQWGLQDRLNVAERAAPFSTYLYLSGTTFFTLGLGDVIPLGRLGRELVVLEAGLGFAFLGGVVTYLPTIYQAFSRREVGISLLDARAGSPQAPENYYGGTVMICQDSNSCSVSGKNGQQNCSRAISRTLFWFTSTRSMSINRGWER